MRCPARPTAQMEPAFSVVMGSVLRALIATKELKEARPVLGFRSAKPVPAAPASRRL